MKDGFIKVAAASIRVSVAGVNENKKEIIKKIENAEKCGVDLLVLPELCVTSYSCGDLFYSDVLLTAAKQALKEIAEATSGRETLLAVGVPLLYCGKLFNSAAVIYGGEILGIIPKTYLPNYAEFYEGRQFSSADKLSGGETISLFGKEIPFGTDIIFKNENMPEFTLGVEICEDLWAPAPPSVKLCEGGATVIANLSASNEVIGKTEYRKMLVKSASAKQICGYVYSSASADESTQDTVFSGHNMVAENGTMLAENTPFCGSDTAITELDLKKLQSERHRNTTFAAGSFKTLRIVMFNKPVRETSLTRAYEKTPFVSSNQGVLDERTEQILKIQSYGLKKRIEAAHAKTAVIGISGGLDSTLALLVAARATDLLNRPRTDILAVTMPGFGTTSRTKGNAQKLCEKLGVTLKEVSISAAVTQHFLDIGHDPSVTDVTYENCQARERTQILMDLANETGGMVIGTGDLSELALGFATYNGDHMSMYGVNCSVPKTLVRFIVRYEAVRFGGELADILNDILATPVSPELLPSDENGNIAQKTEELVGPYELHDFFLYHMIRFGFSPSKLLRLAKYAFKNDYSEEVIKHWLKSFIRRFFAQQYKRSCLPDGPKVGSVTLSPRADWRMPSDATGDSWITLAEKL